MNTYETEIHLSISPIRGNARKRITAFIDADEDVALCAITIAEVFSGWVRRTVSTGATGPCRFPIGTSTGGQPCRPA
jgi:hypothetical protein